MPIKNKDDGARAESDARKFWEMKPVLFESRQVFRVFRMLLIVSSNVSSFSAHEHVKLTRNVDKSEN